MWTDRKRCNLGFVMVRYYALQKIVSSGHHHCRHRQKKRKFKGGGTRHSSDLSGSNRGHRARRTGENSGQNLRRADPNRLRQRHFLHVHRARPSEHGVNDPHDNPADEQRPSHHPETFQVFANDFCESPRRNRGHHKCDKREAQRVREDGAIAAFALRKCADKFDNATPKINRLSENGSELDDDCVHFPKPIMQIDMQQRFADAQVRGRTHRKKFSKSLD
jgi:hypothetical protein